MEPQIHLVTGGSGFIACHVVQQLLQVGHTVHATVRNRKDGVKCGPLEDLQKEYAGKLKLFEADLLVPGTFTPAMQGCCVVHHLASPFLMAENIHDPQKQLIDPAFQGTRNVLNSVNETETVQRVVLMSTIGAIFGDYIDVQGMKDNTLHEKYFNESSTASHNPYHYSKVIAEKEAWKIFEAQSRWDMVVICPGLVLGPSLAPGSESGSLFLLDELLRGDLWFGVPELSFCIVDVRDVAAAHVKAANHPTAHGRYIICEKEMVTFLDIAKHFKVTSKGQWSIPKHQAPSFLVRLVGPLFGLSQKWMRANFGVRFSIDNARSIGELGLSYRPLKETLDDHYSSWIEQRRLKAK